MVKSEWFNDALKTALFMNESAFLNELVPWITPKGSHMLHSEWIYVFFLNKTVKWLTQKQ